MTIRTLMLAAAVAVMLPVGVYAADKAAADTKAPSESIPFANTGGINDWRTANDSDRVIYVQGQNRQWYKGELLTDCIGLRFAERIGFDADASGAFTKFSSVVVDGKKCPLTSLEKTDNPPSKKDKEKKS